MMRNNGIRGMMNIPDYTGDHYWASVLAKRIQSYWNRKGFHQVKVWVETDTTSTGNKYYSVRSNISYNCNNLS